MHDRHIMIDIETLSTRCDAAIIAIGLCEFDLERFYIGRCWNLDVKLVQGHRDPETLEWWGKQNPGVRNQVFGGCCAPETFAHDLRVFFEARFETHWVWAGPSTFDLTILKQFFVNLGQTYPINWRMERDQTTLNELCTQLGIENTVTRAEETLHSPLDDALYQASKVQAYFKRLSGLTWNG